MTEIETKIRHLQVIRKNYILANEENQLLNVEREDILAKVEALTDAIEALREKAEREKGCTHCQKPYVSIGGINEDKAIIYLGAERPYNKGNVEYLHHMDSAGRMNAFKVRHCPMCGKRLEVEP